ncbi:MAG: hypothetical protein H6719_19385 [Sandaracinaceae bacterium]|nr:hypothetical protein [Sandaracinaceae bacterium]
MGPRSAARATLLVALCGLAATARAEPLILEWPGEPEAVNPRAEDQALALFDDDAWNRALVCPRGRAPTQPPLAAGTIRCAFEPVARIAVGGGILTVGVTEHGHEFDGMYGYDEDLVLLSGDAAPRVAHTLTQWRHDVTDAGTEVLMRRHRVVDLDRDGVSELCLETVVESGVGLFPLMELEAHGRRWFPSRRARSIAAFTHDVTAGRLVARPALDRRCPRRGYRPLVPTTTAPPDGVAWRRRVQGLDARGVAEGQRLERRAWR